jgi:hypothetical protein
MKDGRMAQPRHRHPPLCQLRDDITDNSRRREHRRRSMSARRGRMTKQNEALLMRCRALLIARREPFDPAAVAARNTIETFPRAMKPDLSQIL